MTSIDFVRHQVELLLISCPELHEDEVLRADVLEGETDLHAALSKLVRLIGETQAMRDGLAAYVTTLRARDARLERRGDALRELIFKLMQIADLKKVPLPEATLSVRRVPQAVVIFDEALIPDDYLRVKYEPNKTEIKKALEEGKNVAGAEMSNGGETISIRMN